MDIHPPHAPIRSIRDFLLQIFTITCGILIALGLEGVAEWRRGEALAQVTREDFRAEITANIAELTAQRPNEERDLAWMQAMTVFGEAQLRHQPGQAPPLLTQRSFVTLPNAAWETALATQALHQLRFEEARALTSAYSRQAAVNDLTTHPINLLVALSGFDTTPGAMN